MRSLLAVVALPLVACATTGAFDQSLDPASRGNASSVTFDFAARGDEAMPAFPAVAEPRLPSADRLAPQLRHVGAMTADVVVCVRPQGTVASVELTRSSQHAAFDRAMLADVAEWQFAPMAGPDTVKSCQLVTISYRPHRS